MTKTCSSSPSFCCLFTTTKKERTFEKGTIWFFLLSIHLTIVGNDLSLGEKGMKQSSWGCTILIQLSLCLVVYVSLHLGHPFFFSSNNGDDNAGVLDLHFISVAGGFRHLHRQTHLLRLVCFLSCFSDDWNMKVGFRIKVEFFIDFFWKFWVFIDHTLWFHGKEKKVEVFMEVLFVSQFEIKGLYGWFLDR